MGEGNPQALTDALRTLVTDAPRRLRMGRQARAFVESEFDGGQQIARHAALYRGLAEAWEREPERAAACWLSDDYLAQVQNTLLSPPVEKWKAVKSTVRR